MKTTLSDPITSAVRRTLLVSRVVLEFLYDDALVVLHRLETFNPPAVDKERWGDVRRASRAPDMGRPASYAVGR